MINAAFDPALFDSPAASERPLGVSMLASSLVHVLVIAALASVAPRIALLPSWQDADAPLAVELQQRIAIAPAPEPLPRLPAIVSVPMPEPAPVMPDLALAKELRVEPRSSQTETPSAHPAPPLAVRRGPPNPKGSITVGLLYDPGKLSRATAVRLEQRFPVRAVRTPKLGGAVVAHYPAEAARTGRSARVAAVLTIDATGRVVDRDITLVPDDPLFRDAVLAAVASARFAPAEAEGKPIPYWVILDFYFEIDPLPGARAAAGR